MQYLLNDNVGKSRLSLRGEEYKYLFKVRRHQVGDTLFFRHPQSPETLHGYLVENLDGRSAELTLESSEDKAVIPSKTLHLAWCVVDPKSVEKVLPSLNEIGVEKITFIYCERSQNNFKVDEKRYQRILESSSQQCGRSSMIQIESEKNLKSFISKYPQTVVLDFCDQVLDDMTKPEVVLIGCEGGFSEAERALLSQQQSFRLDTPMILRSESAAVAIASKLLL